MGDEFRGRVLGQYSMAGGPTPFGNLGMGAAADTIGGQASVVIFELTGFAFAAVLGLGSARVRRLCGLRAGRGKRAHSRGDALQWGRATTVAASDMIPKPEAAGAQMRGRVLIVDDDHRLLDTLERALRFRGYPAAVAADASEALAAFEGQAPDVVVLDIMMPGLDGLVLCRLLRERSGVPILMLTARDSVPDRVAGLQAGADDYLIKPFALDELVARIEALLRRAAKGTTKAPLAYADIVLDPAAWSVSRAGQELDLTPTEFRLLECLMSAPEQVVTRDQILRTVWGSEWVSTDSNVIEVHVANLRHKLESEGAARLIRTIRGIGYMIKM